MAPVDPTTTMRIRARYAGPMGEHTMLFHAQDGIDRAEFLGDVQDFIDQAMLLQYAGTVWSDAEFADAGSALFFPMTDWTPITTTSTHNPNSSSTIAIYLQFGGRTTGAGTRVKLYLFETWLTANPDMRLPAGVVTELDNTLTELASVDNNIGAIDGGVVVWKNYANIGFNDHLTRKART
jgi:hypothetical protein